MSKSTYNSPLLNTARLGETAAPLPAMSVPTSAPLRQGLVQQVKTALHGSRAAGEMTRSLIDHNQKLEVGLGKLAMETAAQIAAKTLVDSTAQQLTAMDERLTLKEQSSKTALFTAFAIGDRHQQRAKKSADQDIYQEHAEGLISTDEANLRLARLEAAHRWINESQDRAFVDCSHQIEARFAAARAK